MNKPFWKSDWFIGLTITLVFFFLAGSDVLQTLERKVYDLGVSLTPARSSNDHVVVVAIDDDTLKEFGDQSLPRDAIAEVIKKINAAKSAAIGLALDLSEEENARALTYISRFAKLSDLGSNAILTADFSAKYQKLLEEATRDLNTDRVLANTLNRARNVVLAIPYRQAATFAQTLDASLPEYLLDESIHAVPVNRPGFYSYLPKLIRPDQIPAARTWYPPLRSFTKVVKSVGHFEPSMDLDGLVRSEPLVVRDQDHLVPSFSLMVAAASMGLSIEDIKVQLGHGVSMGKDFIETDSAYRFYPTFYKNKDKNPFETVSFRDVYKGKVPLDTLRGKVVLIGYTDAGHAEPVSITTGKLVPPLMVTANTIASILNREYYVVTGWAKWIELLAMLFVASYLVSVLPRIKLGTGITLSAIMVVVLLNVNLILMVTQGLWFKFLVPILQLFVGHAILTAKRSYEETIVMWRAEMADSNRMLGLAFQNQGQLDLALEKFRKCPMDDSLLDLLYNLGLDYERKRQFTKAGTVFRYISEHNPDYRDVNKRIMSNYEVEGLYIRGGGGANAAPNGTLVLKNNGIQKPMLGRYEIKKELGRGAMGMVYLGEDPKIGRTVAIKTMALAQEFDEGQLENVKDRFFREARTAGRLNHPNIVTIYDVGEEFDLAYIAMDYIEGENLFSYTKADTLLPLPDVFNIINKVALALDYAHNESVVHRDIKPANVMYNPENKKVTVTDFGVACLTDSSKTKTGTVLGTPSYMSPEQLAGQKVDGRSDLFSLGVMFFQLVTGELPFIGDSMASLMYKITNEKHPDVRMFRLDLPPCVGRIIDKALCKEANKRFQTGKDFIRAINKCKESIEHRKKITRDKKRNAASQSADVEASESE